MQKFNRALIVANPISGSGLASLIAPKFKTVITNNKIEVFSIDSRSHYQSADFPFAFDSSTLIISIGGDGTLSGLLPWIVRSHATVYMVPMGNESLFAREFGMRRNPEDLDRALKLSKVVSMNLPRIGERYFTSMLSVGLDSHVIARIASVRRGPIGHHGYIMPSIRAYMEHKPTPMHVIADGKPFVENQSGMLIIARTRQYARRIILVPEADREAPVLHARFFPIKVVRGYLKFLPALITGKISPHLISQSEAGRSFTISADNPVPIQADGEFVGNCPASVELEITPLNILCPPSQSIHG